MDHDQNNNNENQQIPGEEEEEEAFIDLDDAVEVEVDDSVPMDDDDNDDENENENIHESGNLNIEEHGETNQNQQPDMSIYTIKSHSSSSVYCVDTHFVNNHKLLSIISGGGDDKAFLHIVSPIDKQIQTILLAHPHSDSISAVAFNTPYITDDRTKTPHYIAVGSYDGTVALYNPDDSSSISNNSKPPIQVLDGPTDVEFISFHPKGGSVLLAGSISDGTMWMYHLPTKKCLQVFVGHECMTEGGGVTSGCFTPDGKFALSIGMDGTLRIWAPRTGVCRHVFKLCHTTTTQQQDAEEGSSGLTCLDVDGGQDGQLAIAGGEDGNAYVVHLQGRKLVSTLRHFDPSSFTSPSTSTLANNNKMDVDEGNEGEDEEDMYMTSVEAVKFAPKIVNHNWVATGGSDGLIKIWDLTHDCYCRQTCKVVSSSNGSSSGGVTRLVWHSTLPLIFASYADGAVRLWDARNGQLLHTMTGGGDASGENQINDISVQFIGGNDVSSAVVVTAVDDGTVKIFDVDVHQILKTNQVS